MPGILHRTTYPRVLAADDRRNDAGDWVLDGGLLWGLAILASIVVVALIAGLSLVAETESDSAPAALWTGASGSAGIDRAVPDTTGIGIAPPMAGGYTPPAAGR